MDDIFEKKRPKFNKFQKNYETANRRICNTYDQLGQLHKMKDKVGQKFESILIKQLREASEIEMHYLSEEEAEELNKEFNTDEKDVKTEKKAVSQIQIAVKSIDKGSLSTDRSKVEEQKK